MAGAVEELVAALVGGRFAVLESTVTVGVTSTQILPPNPERATWVVVNTGGANLYVAFRPEVTGPSAIPIGANGGSLSANWHEDLVLPTRGIYGLVGAGNTTVYIVEVVREAA